MPANQQPCPICGGTTFAWGGFNGFRFIPMEPDELSKPRDNDPFGDQALDAYARLCQTCGNIMTFAVLPVFDEKG